MHGVTPVGLNKKNSVLCVGLRCAFCGGRGEIKNKLQVKNFYFKLKQINQFCE
jgi:hypothetical protein